MKKYSLTDEQPIVYAAGMMPRPMPSGQASDYRQKPSGNSLLEEDNNSNMWEVILLMRLVGILRTVIVKPILFVANPPMAMAYVI